MFFACLLLDTQMYGFSLPSCKIQLSNDEHQVLVSDAADVDIGTSLEGADD